MEESQDHDEQLLREWYARARSLGVVGKPLRDLKTGKGESASNISQRSRHFLRDVRPEPTDISVELPRHLERLGRISPHYKSTLERMFGIGTTKRPPPEDTGPPKTPDRASRPTTPGAPRRESAVPTSTTPDHPLGYFFRLCRRMSQAAWSNPEEQNVPTATHLGAFSRAWNLFAEISPQASKLRQSAPLPTLAFDLGIPIPKLNLRATDHQPAAVLEETSTQLDDLAEDMGDVDLEDSPLRRKGPPRTDIAEAPSVLEPEDAPDVDDSGPDERGYKRTHTESVVAELLTSLIDALASTFLCGNYAACVTTSDQKRFAIGGLGPLAELQFNTCVDGYTAIGKPDRRRFLAVFEVKASARPGFSQGALNLVRRQETAEIAALEFMHGQFDDGGDNTETHPSSHILISATPQAAYISIAEAHQEWQRYIRGGQNVVCSKKGGLKIQEMIKIHEYGPIEYHDFEQMRMFGYVIVSLIAKGIRDARQGET